MTLQSKLLDLTCTHANTLHATDCKDCIQLVNDITQLFIDEGWRVPQKPLDQEKAEELLENLYYTKTGGITTLGNSANVVNILTLEK